MTRDSNGYLTALRALMMPADTNHQGTVFGGVILSRIDQAGYLEARKNGRHRWVTASLDQVNFVAPVFDGDTVSFKTRTIRTGRSSVTVEVLVEAERHATGDVVHVTDAKITMVSVNAAGQAIPFDSAPTIGAGS
jgi:acyl-CoA thioesterase YciA